MQCAQVFVVHSNNHRARREDTTFTIHIHKNNIKERSTVKWDEKGRGGGGADLFVDCNCSNNIMNKWCAVNF